MNKNTQGVRVPNEEVLNSSSADFHTEKGFFSALMENGGVYKITNRRLIEQQLNSKKNLGFDTDSCPSQ